MEIAYSCMTFTYQIERCVAEDSRVVAIRKSTTGNMGRVIYVFKVHKSLQFVNGNINKLELVPEGFRELKISFTLLFCV